MSVHLALLRRDRLNRGLALCFGDLDEAKLQGYRQRFWPRLPSFVRQSTIRPVGWLAQAA